ncbi:MULTISPECIES: hypothetical protein [Myxococcus]|uniref:hypothetical protein n=1 Tax=Myxococcus TaxID=32 RepID=UPI001F2C294E|nr:MULTISPECIES: hypothetical protein [Myxococcus]WAM25294.1 hypothetical protein OZ403_32970 [Myxococcus sp. NMCA1]
MALNVFRKCASLLVGSVSLFAMTACGPVDTELEEAEVGTSREALSTISHRSSSTASATNTTSLTLSVGLLQGPR